MYATTGLVTASSPWIQRLRHVDVAEPVWSGTDGLRAVPRMRHKPAGRALHRLRWCHRSLERAPICRAHARGWQVEHYTGCDARD
jgi:hypothetical protein